MLLKFIFLSLSRVYSSGIGLLLILFSAGILGLTVRGEIAISVTWMTAFFTFLHLSIGQLGYKKVLEDKKRGKEIILYFIIYDLFITLLLAIFLPLIYDLFIPTNKISLIDFYFALSLVPIMMLEQQLLSLFLASNDTNVLNRISITNRTLNFLITLLLIYLLPNYYTFIICLFILSAAMAYSYYKNINYTGRYVFDAHEFFQLIKNGVGFHFFNAFGYIGYTLLPLLILPKFISSEKFALYEIGFRFISLVMIIATSCQLMGMRAFSKERDVIRGWSQYLRIILIYFSLSYTAVFAFLILYPFISAIPFLIKFNLSFSVFKELLPYVPLIGTTAFLPTLFVNLNMLKLSAIYNFTLGLCCFILIIIFTKLLGVSGLLLSLKIIYSFAGVLFIIIICYVYNEKIRILF